MTLLEGRGFAEAQERIRVVCRGYSISASVEQMGQAYVPTLLRNWYATYI